MAASKRFCKASGRAGKRLAWLGEFLGGVGWLDVSVLRLGWMGCPKEIQSIGCSATYYLQPIMTTQGALQ